LKRAAEEFSLRGYLAKRLMPGTLAIAFIISIVFPVTYYVDGRQALKKTAMLYAYEFSDKIYNVIVNYPTLWKYQVQKHLQAVHEFVPYKNVTDLHVIDDKGQQITEYDFKGVKRHEHGYFSACKGTAPIIFNNRAVGTVEVYVSLMPVLTSSLLIFLVSLAVGTGLAYFAYSFPLRVVKKAEEKLRESESKYRDLAELLPQIVFELDDKGNIIFFNQHALTSLGYTQDDFNKGLHAFQMFIPEDLDRVGKNIQRVLSGEVLYGIEYTARRKDGTLFPVHLSASPIVHEDKITGIRGIAIDISELKQAEDEIKEAEQEWERTFDSITAPIMILDTHHKIIKANKSMADKMGVTLSEAIGLTCYMAVHGKDEPPSFCPHAALLVDGQSHSTEVYEEKLGGHYIITVSPLFAPDGTLYGSVHYAADITERKQAEEEREKFINELKEALANIKTLSGMLPICASCKKIRNDKGYWSGVESYVSEHSEAVFTSGICPDCEKKAYEDLEKLKNEIT